MASSAPPPRQPPAGWYPDPNGSGLRWWDGEQWTESVSDPQPPAESQPPLGRPEDDQTRADDPTASGSGGRARAVLLIVAGFVVVAGIVLAAKSISSGDGGAAYAECNRDVQPVFSAMQDLGSHLDVGVVQRDYAAEVGDVNATYDRLEAKHPATPCQPVVRALGEAMDAYSEASSEWNECIFSEEEECAEVSVPEFWAEARVAIAKGKKLLNSLADGPDAVAAAAADEAQAAADELAEQQLFTAEVVIETYSVDHGGSYADATVASLQHIEPTVPDNLEVESTSSTYTISVPSEGGNWFAISNEEGPLSYTCGEQGKGACPTSGEWE